MSKPKPYTITAIRAARWIMECGAPGTRWVTGAFTPNCEAELVRMGVLVPAGPPGISGMFTVAHVDIDSLPVRPARRSR